MYKNLSFFGKIISFILLVIAMILIKNYNIFLIVCGMIFILSFINRDKKYFIVCFILFLVTFLVPYNDILFIILRVLLVITYALIILSSLLSLEKRYLYDKFFYRSKSNKKLRGYIKRYYYEDIVNRNISSNNGISKYLNKSELKKYDSYLVSQAKKKADIEIDNIYLIDRIRFDHFGKKKKNKLAFTWNSYDNLYMFVSLLLFVIVIVLGR